MSDDYSVKQSVMDQQYRDVFESPEVKKWIADLSPEERKRMEKEGLLKPMLPSKGSGKGEQDWADSPLASEENHPIDQIEPKEISMQPASGEEVQDVLRRLIAEMLTQKNTRLTLECLAAACGLNVLQGESLSEIAKRHGLSRAAVSKRCVDITTKLNLVPSRSMKAGSAREKYSRTQKQIRRRHERVEHQRQ